MSVFNFDHSYGQAYSGTYQWGVGMVQAPTITDMAQAVPRKFARMSIERCQRDIYYRRNENCDRVYLASCMEWPAIVKGDTARIKWMFDNSVITHIEIEGVGETTPEDVQKGQFVIEVTPEQTTLYKAHIHIKHADGTVSVNPELANRRVIVVSDRKTQNNIFQMYTLDKANRQIEKLSRYMDSHAGGVREGKWTYFPDKLNTYIENVSGLNPNVEPVTEKFQTQKPYCKMKQRNLIVLSWNLESGCALHSNTL